MIPFFTSNQGKALESRVDTLEQAGGGGTEVSASTQLVTGAVTANSLKIGNTDYNLPQPAQVLPNYLNEQYEKVNGDSVTCEVASGVIDVTFIVSQPLSQRHTFVVRNKTKNAVVYGEPAGYGYDIEDSSGETTSDYGQHFIIKLVGHQKKLGSTSYYDETTYPNDYVDFQDNTNNSDSDKTYDLLLAGAFALLDNGGTWEAEDDIEVECITSPVPFYIGSVNSQ